MKRKYSSKATSSLRRYKEKDIQRVLARYWSDRGYVVKREVKTPVGYIDLILYRDMGSSGYRKEIIEVKEWKGIKHAIGQLLSYERYQGDCTGLKIIYFTRDGKYKGIDGSFQNEELRKINRKLSINYINYLEGIEEYLEELWIIEEDLMEEEVGMVHGKGHTMIEVLVMESNNIEMSIPIFEEIQRENWTF